MSNAADVMPRKLQDTPHWVCWRLEQRNNKMTKLPYDPKTGKLASSTGPETWASFELALDAVAAGGYNGVGFVFSNDNTFTGVDLDHCVKDGAVEPWAKQIVNLLDSYTELSPSGTGLHIIIKGKLPEGVRCRKGAIEIYSRDRYFTMTGKPLEGTPATVNNRQTKLEALHQEVFGTPEVPTDAHEHNRGVRDFGGSDEELIAAIRDSADRKTFVALFDYGDLSSFDEDNSKADFALCCILIKHGGVDEDRIDRIVQRSALCRDKWTRRTDYRNKTIEAATKAVAENRGKPRGILSYPFTDAGTAELFAATYAGRFVFNHDAGKWLVYDGQRWNPKAGGHEVRKAVVQLARQIRAEALKPENVDRRETIEKYARSLESSTKISNVLREAQAEMVHYGEEFDSDLMLFNCRNGTIDLRTGKLLPHCAKHMISHLAPVEVDRDAKCPRWDKFMSEIMAGNDVMIQYLYRLLGMCLTGLVQEQTLLIFCGGGANGKSVLLDTATALMGSYATEAPPDVLIEKRNVGHPTEVADFYGRRLVIASENEEGAVLKIQLIKRLTGNARLKGRYMRRDFFEFDRTHKLILVTNNKPVVREKTNAVWRRLRLIPFGVEIAENNQDKGLLAKLESEWPGILNHLVRGCLEWQQYGLQEPEEIGEATWEYRAEQSPLDDFVSECCELDPFAVTPVSILRENYEKWLENTGRKGMASAQKFNAAMRRIGCKYDTQYFGGITQKVWCGIDLCKNLTESF